MVVWGNCDCRLEIGKLVSIVDIIRGVKGIIIKKWGLKGFL